MNQLLPISLMTLIKWANSHLKFGNETHKFIQEETDSQNSPIFIKEIEFRVKNFSAKN